MCLLLCFFGVHSSFNDIFLLIRIPYLLVQQYIPFGGGLRVDLFSFFIRMSKNGNSFELCSTVNSILGCRFCSQLCNSLMSSHGHFQNMKRSFEYIFHDLVNSSFMSLPYFLPIILYRFSSKYDRVKVAYVGAFLVLIAVPSVWI